jgi:hypothetical protein
MNAMMRITGLLLAGTVVSACAQSAGSSPGGGGSGNVSGPVPPGPGTPSTPRLVTPVPGLADVHPIRWAKVTARPGRRLLTVAFWAEPCFDVDHVALAEEADRVIVTVYVGTPPSAQNQPCAQSAEYREVQVTTASPVGTRRVIDGA